MRLIQLFVLIGSILLLAGVIPGLSRSFTASSHDQCSLKSSESKSSKIDHAATGKFVQYYIRDHPLSTTAVLENDGSKFDQFLITALALCMVFWKKISLKSNH
ncbi:MAG: hypothetical protein KTR32_35905 [Granulosicoccus sp.]|nr:hypothetical protein [Granulosicoccus sp.]